MVEKRRDLAGGEWAGVFVTTALVALVALALFLPWRPPVVPGSADLQRYLPYTDGEALSLVGYDQSGTPHVWISQNVELVPPLQLYESVDERASDQIVRYATPGFTGSPRERIRQLYGNVQVVRVHEVEIDREGAAAVRELILMRSDRGDELVARLEPGTSNATYWDPPLPLLPATLDPGYKWSAEGMAGDARYEIVGRVESDDARCIVVVRDLIISTAEESRAQTAIDRLCENEGFVGGQRGERASELRIEIVSTGSPAPPRSDDRTVVRSVPPKPSDAWRSTRWAQSRGGTDAQSTIPPLWLAGDPPLLLTATYNGDLVAYDASSPVARERWRFHPGGTIYGPPAYDSVTGRLFVGASDKRLYALDRRGLYLWSIAVGDNVAGRPLVVDGTVIFGSEDRHIYGVDAASGARRWTPIRTGGPVVASPVLAGNAVLIGSDDGALYAIDPRSGARLWRYEGDAPITTEVVVRDGLAYFTSQDGTLTALDPTACSPETCEPLWVSRPLRDRFTSSSPPEVGEAVIWMVDELGGIAALDRASGRRLSRSAGDPLFVGPPRRALGSLWVVDREGTLHRFALESWTGRSTGLGPAALESWPMQPPARSEQLASSVWYAPEFGGGAWWIADDQGVIHRVGVEDG